MLVGSIVFFLFISSIQAYYYGRAFGVASNWTQIDKSHSHHLEVYFKPMPGMSQFQANIDIRSRDGTSLMVAFVSGAGLSKIVSAFSGKANTGVAQISASQGFLYCNFLSQSQFTSVPEAAYSSKLQQYLRTSRFVYFFGQVYQDKKRDEEGMAGIHDIHRINGLSGYGDGGVIFQDASGNYNGVFAYFTNQALC
jgi:hypothetical protein